MKAKFVILSASLFCVLLLTDRNAIAQGTVIDNGSNNKWVFHNPPNSTTLVLAKEKSGGGWDWGMNLVFYGNGQMGIKKGLTVSGIIQAREVRVTANATADFVFEENYALRPLLELDQFVKENKHLPEIAPAAQMVKEGVNTGEFQIQLLQKIEELTLYVIAQEKRIEALEVENNMLKQ